MSESDRHFEVSEPTTAYWRHSRGRETGMAEDARASSLAERLWEVDRRVLHLAGVRYWTASLLPALVGTTLPFWLRPPGFSLRWLAALEFLLATLLLHAGFSLLHAMLKYRLTSKWSACQLLGAAGVCLVAACLLGMHLNGSVPPHDSVPAYIFIVYGLTTLFAGVLYVIPPFSFSERASGEVILAEGLGMLPVLGAYLVQVGDLNRTVYLAAMPLVVATGLWVWVDELISMNADRNEGRGTMVLLFGARFSGHRCPWTLDHVLREHRAGGSQCFTQPAGSDRADFGRACLENRGRLLERLREQCVNGRRTYECVRAALCY